MSQIQDRIPRAQFQEIFRPMIRTLGTKNVIIRLNEAAKIAIPRQSKLDELMPKLELLCYEQKRTRVEEGLEQMWEFYLANRLGDNNEQFEKLCDDLNNSLDQDKLSTDPEKRAATDKAILAIMGLLQECDLTEFEVEAVFRVKAYADVLDLFLSHRPKSRRTKTQQ